MTKFLGVSMIVLGTVILLLSYLSQANDAIAVWFPVSLVDINGVQFLAFFNLIIGGLIAHVYGIKNAAKTAEEGKSGSALAITSIVLGVISLILAAASLIIPEETLHMIQRDAELATAKYDKQNEFAETMKSDVKENEELLDQAKGCGSVNELIDMQKKLSEKFAANPNDKMWDKVDPEQIEMSFDRLQGEYQSIHTEYTLIQDREAYKAEYAKLRQSIIDPVLNDTSLTQVEKEQAIQSMALVEADSITYDVFSKKYFKQYMNYLQENEKVVAVKDIEEVSVVSYIMSAIKGVFFSITGAVYIPAFLILIALVTTMITLRTKKKALGYANLGLLLVGLIIAFITCITVYPNA